MPTVQLKGSRSGSPGTRDWSHGGRIGGEQVPGVNTEAPCVWMCRCQVGPADGADQAPGLCRWLWLISGDIQAAKLHLDPWVLCLGKQLTLREAAGGPAAAGSR